ncbi:MAG TPA: hypothetical protein VFL19_06755, partial [Nitrospira sp.]|nr:hypothetical protein [Nitrospira sp.]
MRVGTNRIRPAWGSRAAWACLSCLIFWSLLLRALPGLAQDGHPPLPPEASAVSAGTDQRLWHYGAYADLSYIINF